MRELAVCRHSIHQPGMSFTPAWHQRCLSIASPRSFLHPMRYILTSSSRPPAARSKHSLGTVYNYLYRCTRYLLSFLLATCQYSPCLLLRNTLVSIRSCFLPRFLASICQGCHLASCFFARLPRSTNALPLLPSPPHLCSSYTISVVPSGVGILVSVAKLLAMIYIRFASSGRRQSQFLAPVIQVTSSRAIW